MMTEGQFGIEPEGRLLPKEQPLKLSHKKGDFIIGVPKEVLKDETRVALNPQTVKLLTANGIHVIVEHNAGIRSNYTDKDFSEQGAEIEYDVEQLYKKAKYIVKVAPPTIDELHLMQPQQVLFSAVHIGGLKKEYLQILLRKHIIAVGFEFLQTEDKIIPIMQSMSEIAGITAVHIASELLSVSMRGPGKLLGGITGVPPAVVTILGAGTVGYYAAKTAMAMGAEVRVLDASIRRLKRLTSLLRAPIYTAITRPDHIRESVLSSDVLIGAVYKKGHRSPVLVTTDMIMDMKEKSVVIDVAIDQGGCIETSEPRTHSNPVYLKYGVIHYSVPNIPARVPQTASEALSNVLGPLLLRIKEAGGIKNAIGQETIIRNGIYTYLRHLTQPTLAKLFDMPYLDIVFLYSAQL